MVAAELRLMLKGVSKWWYLVVVGLWIASVASPLEISRGLLIAIWIWPLLLWSRWAHGNFFIRPGVTPSSRMDHYAGSFCRLVGHGSRGGYGHFGRQESRVAPCLLILISSGAWFALAN
jgi:hypothetical protein